MNWIKGHLLKRFVIKIDKLINREGKRNSKLINLIIRLIGMYSN